MRILFVGETIEQERQQLWQLMCLAVVADFLLVFKPLPVRSREGLFSGTFDACQEGERLPAFT